MPSSVHTAAPLLPPSARSHAALGLTSAAARGRFELQVCLQCSAVQYPPREACRNCLTGRLAWRPQDDAGELIAETLVHHSNDFYFRSLAPWRIGAVRLSSGVTVIAHVHDQCARAPAEVRIRAMLDRSGQGVLVAYPAEKHTINSAPKSIESDPRILAMSCTPKGRRVLVTHGNTPLGKAIVQELINARASVIWTGWLNSGAGPVGGRSAGSVAESAGASSSQTGPAGHNSEARVHQVPLDIHDATSADLLAEFIGDQVDILINNPELQAPNGGHGFLESAQAEMDTSYFGLLRLARSFGPRMRARASKAAPPVAWVNLLSTRALAPSPALAAHSAAAAAAHSYAQTLRGEMRSVGIRVLNVYPDMSGGGRVPTAAGPTLGPQALARAIALALEDSIEDLFPGDAAQDLYARWREDPKVLELELQQT